MKFCNCALPALRGDTECCKNCINEKEIPDGFISDDELKQLFDKINTELKYETLLRRSNSN